jgi:hypothetical protein
MPQNEAGAKKPKAAGAKKRVPKALPQAEARDLLHKHGYTDDEMNNIGQWQVIDLVPKKKPATNK